MSMKNNFCRYLTLILYLRDNYNSYKCMCNEVTGANCLKDGICPIYEERLKIIKELNHEE